MLPLAERLRPKTLDDYIGQQHLVGPGCMLRSMIEQQHIPSMILWGPPGVGKTTLAEIIANTVKVPFYTLSAVTSGVKDVREVIERAKQSSLFNQGNRPILFIDEIHRFSKSQQDSLLGAVERGVFTLIGATTENPSFEVIRPLLSRCQVYVLKQFEKDDLLQLLERAVKKDILLSKLQIDIQQTGALLRFSGGDARRLLGILELLQEAAVDGKLVIDDALVEKQLEATPLAYDKLGDMHYDVISAFIKSIRGSDPQAALYYLARMMEGGEDPVFIARRLIISSSEDIGLANPNALLLANAAFDAVSKIGWPEARIPLAEATTYLALSPKSNSAYMGINSAVEAVKRTGNLPVPMHIRNAPTNLMAELGYSDGYKYPHDYPGNYVAQEYLPEQLKDAQFYVPQSSSATEARLAATWRERTKGNDND
ncbi:MAG: replication-associated recombination protein A [Bacteroidaceae bacterium]|nr:replication-associated recombination protein A [Bacteroidaceae bacterium]